MGNVLGRRKLLVVGTAVAAEAACSGGDPYSQGTGHPNPHPTGAGDAGPGSTSSSSSSSGSSSSSSGSGSSSSGSGSSSGGSSGSSSGGGSGGSSGGTSCPTGANVFTLTFAQYPQLKSVGGTVTVNAPGYQDPTCGMSSIIVIQASAGQFVALSAACTHACCNVLYLAGGLLCPCHAAGFDLTGKVTRGPAQIPLANLPVCADASGVYVTLK